MLTVSLLVYAIRPQVDISEVMEVATSSLEFDPEKPHTELIWRTNFNKPSSKVCWQSIVAFSFFLLGSLALNPSLELTFVAYWFPARDSRRFLVGGLLLFRQG